MKAYKILILALVFAIMTQMAMAAEDYTCVDKTSTKSPPPKSAKDVKSDLVKTPLCEKGKVPKSTINKDTEKAKLIIDTPLEVAEANADGASCSGGLCFDFATSHAYVPSKGVYATLTQHNPEIDPIYGVSSSASIGIGQYVGSWLRDYVSVGWGKDNGDVIRLGTVYRSNGYTYCPNTCGWVQDSWYYYPGMAISTNTWGVGYEIQYFDGDWWVYWNGEWLGYYPGYLWDYTFNEGDRIVYQGSVVSTTSATKTDMGNGLWASNYNAASMRDQEYLSNNGWWNTAYTTKYTTSPSLYTVLSTGSNSMRYGGPGVSSSSITVISPNGGENWQKGTTKTIQWSSSGAGSYVKIELLKGGVLYSTIAYSTPNDGSHSWYIPTTLATGSDYKIRITSTSNSASDMSNNNFAIGTASSITVTSPNGGENWVRGTTKQIKWSYAGNPGQYVKVELLKGGYVNKVLTYSTPIGSYGTGYYNWNIPATQTLGSDYKIRVTSTSNSGITDTSNNNFVISSSTGTSITVISPNGGESWARGTTKLITWTYSGSPGANVKIELYKAGILKSVINSYTANDGSYSWSIPWTLPIGSDYKIKIISTSSSYNDFSNNYFKIY